MAEEATSGVVGLSKAVGQKSRDGFSALYGRNNNALWYKCRGMEAREESKRRQADLVARHVCD